MAVYKDRGGRVVTDSGYTQRADMNQLCVYNDFYYVENNVSTFYRH